MKFLALISGGKDSIYAINKLIDEGNTLVGIVYVESTVNTIDSYMYQTVGHEIVQYYEECLNVPLFIIQTTAKSSNTDLEYQKTENDEVEDLFDGLFDLTGKIQYDAISSGAIFSKYQSNRLQNICGRLNKELLSPLWGMDQEYLLQEMIKYGIEAVIVKIASPGLIKECIGMNLKEFYNFTKKKHSEKKLEFINFNFCGEGGEFETVTLNAPNFVKKIEISKYCTCMHPEETIREWNVFYMQIDQSQIK